MIIRSKAPLRLGQSQLASATLRKIFEKRFGWGEKI